MSEKIKSMLLIYISEGLADAILDELERLQVPVIDSGPDDIWASQIMLGGRYDGVVVQVSIGYYLMTIDQGCGKGRYVEGKGYIESELNSALKLME